MTINRTLLIFGERQHYVLATYWRVSRTEKIQSAFLYDGNDCPCERPCSNPKWLSYGELLLSGGQRILHHSLFSERFPKAHNIYLGRTQTDRVGLKLEPNIFFPRPDWDASEPRHDTLTGTV